MSFLDNFMNRVIEFHRDQDEFDSFTQQLKDAMSAPKETTDRNQDDSE